jgi:RES domain-containing protein
MHNQPALAPAVVATRPLARVLAALTFRAVHLRHFAIFAAARPLHAAPGGVAGSRYVLPHGPAALYTAFGADTAHREGNQVFYQAAAAPAGPALLRAGGLRPYAVVMLGLHVRVTRLLDLRDPAIRLPLGVQADAELLAPWRGVPNAPTQMLGDTVFNDGYFEGIIHPSAQNLGHDCLVLFPDRLLATSGVDFFDATTALAAHLP